MLTDHDHDIDPALERKGADKPITPELSQRAGRTTDVSDNPLPVQSDRVELEKHVIHNLDLKSTLSPDLGGGMVLIFNL